MFRQLTHAAFGATTLSARVMAKAVAVPVDTALWAHHTTNRKPPTWHSRNEIVLESPFALLRDFSAGDDDVVPTLVFPPLAGHASCIIDKKGQSQIQLCIKMGLTRLYSFDWLSCTKAAKDTTEADRLDFITRAADLIAGPEGTVNIVGNCQGGWEAVLWTALHPERVNTLIVAGAPIDTSAGGGLAKKLMPILIPRGNMALYKAMVAANGGIVPGINMVMGFIAMHPITHVAEHLKVYAHVHDRAYLDHFNDFYDWYLLPGQPAGQAVPVGRGAPVRQQRDVHRRAGGRGPDREPAQHHLPGVPARRRTGRHHAVAAGPQHAARGRLYAGPLVPRAGRAHRPVHRPPVAGRVLDADPGPGPPALPTRGYDKRDHQHLNPSAAGRASEGNQGLLNGSADLDEAEQILRARADAGDERAARRLAELLAQRGDLDEAEQILRARADTGDESAVSRLAELLAELLAERGDLDDAEQILRARADTGDESAVLRLAELLAELLAQHGDLDKLRTRADADDRDGTTEPAGLLEERADPDGA